MRLTCTITKLMLRDSLQSYYILISCFLPFDTFAPLVTSGLSTSRKQGNTLIEKIPHFLLVISTSRKPLYPLVIPLVEIAPETRNPTSGILLVEIAP